MSRKYAVCVGCGKIEYVSNMIAEKCNNRGDKPIYICTDCDESNNTYGTRNNNVVGKVNNGFKVGIELETTGSSRYARTTLMRFGFIPTHDCSLNDNYDFQERDDGYGGYECSCEYVSSINKGIKRFTKQFVEIEKMLNDNELTIDESCGTHCHISYNHMEMHNGMHKICYHFHDLFTPLQDVMISNREKTTLFFGRYFTGYAPAFNECTQMRVGNHDNRYCWVNCTNYDRIEFRLNKFRTAEQMRECIKFEQWIIKTIYDNFLIKCYHMNESNDEMKMYAMKTGKKLARKLEKIYDAMV